MAEHHYIWRGVNRQGTTVSGDATAKNSEEIRHMLLKQRIRATSVQRVFRWPTWLQIHRQSHATPRDILQFTRQLATLLRAGLPLLQAFQILKRGEHQPRMKVIIATLHTQIELGTPMHQALQQHHEFDALYCNLIAVGELAGMLDVMLERLALHLEKSQAMRATLRSAMLYPSAVLGIAVSVLTLILVFVVPAFENIFSSFNAELPWLTRCVITLSKELQTSGIGIGISMVAISWGLQRMFQTNEVWRRQWHRFLLHLPVAGPLIRHACTARWTRTLATLFSAGIPLADALDAVQHITGHMAFQTATQRMHTQLTEGITLSYALEQTAGLFPNMLVQMCAIGEESGALGHMLEKTAEHYENEVENTVARLSTLLEPFIMVVLGLLIGGLVMALYLPIFQLGQVV